MESKSILLVVILLMVCSGVSQALTMDMVTVGNAGNAGEKSQLAKYGDTTYYGGVSRTVPDDYPTIQQGIDAARRGDTVEIKPGIYNESLLFKDGINLVKCIKNDETGEVLVSYDAKAAPALTVISCQSGTISGITFSHSNVHKLTKEKPNYCVLHLKNSSVKVTGCTIKNGNSAGIRIEGNSSCDIKNCSVYNNTASGILVLGNKAKVTLNNNQCLGNKVNGIHLVQGATGVVKNNKCNDNIWNGISVVNRETTVTLTGNECLKNTSSGIYLGEGADGTVENNICNQNKWHGISVADNQSAPMLRNNRCYDNERAGIYLPVRAVAKIENNTCKNNGEINGEYICGFLTSKKFDELEEIASRLRSEHPKFKNGNSQLSHFYYSLGKQWFGFVPSKEDVLISLLEQWVKQKPQSVTPYIIMAKVYVNFGWAARSYGWAYEVTEEGWKVFYEKLQKAWEILKIAETLETKDPEIYKVFLEIGRGLGKPAEEMDILFDKGIAIDREYHPLYYTRATSLRPKWGGKDGEIEAFADKAVYLTKDIEGESLYAIIAGLAVPRYDTADPDEFLKHNFSYKRIKQGFIEILERYPESTQYLNSYCLLASIHKDKITARELFDKIGDKWDNDTWVFEKHFKRYRNWAYGQEKPR